MFRHYLSIAIRSLSRNRMYSVINLLGLTVGLAACLLVTTVVVNDLSYDRQWTKGRNIYRIVSINNRLDHEERFAQSFTGLGPALKQQFPEVTDYCRMQTLKTTFRLGEKTDGVEIKCLSADTSIWHFLDFSVLNGNPRKFAPGYPNLIISESLKNQLFPSVNPIGKTVETIPDFGEKKTYLITGVIKDLPANTNLYAQALIVNTPTLPQEDVLSKTGDGSFLPQYLLLRSGTDIGLFTKKINNWYKDFAGGKPRLRFALQPLSGIHLHPGFANDPDTGGSMREVYIFSGVAFLLLLIACINFVNLTAARILKRAKETGVRKILGAGKKQLVMQFLVESVLFFFISSSGAIILYYTFIGSVEKFTGRPVAFSLLHHGAGLPVAVGAILLVSIFAGLYPALLFSRPAAINIVKGKLVSGLDTTLLRKILITGQFILSILLIIAMLITSRQLQFLEHKNLGYDDANLLKTNFISWGTSGEAFRQEVLKIPGVENASISRWSPGFKTGGFMSMEIDDPEDAGKKIQAWYISGDIDLIPTLHLQLLKGRMLNEHLATDVVNYDSLMSKGDFATVGSKESTQPVLITEYTARLLKIKQLDVPSKVFPGTPVGIVKDFNNESLREKLKPCIIRAERLQYGYLLIRVHAHDASPVLTQINTLWRKFYPGRLLQTEWISDLLADQYKTEKKLAQLFIFFSSMSIFLACLGLFGMIAFTAEQRTREIGIRKVLGASLNSVVQLLVKDFVVLVLIAFLISAPIAWWAANRWLQNFAYHIRSTWWIFVSAGLLAMMIASITVGFQALKSAMANPSEALRSE